MKNINHGKQFLKFISQSPTPYHVVANIKEKLVEQEFTELWESKKWKLKQGGRYFVVKNDSALICFTLGNKAPADTGFKIFGAHTDSPGLKLKPNPEKELSDFVSLGVEVYGGPLLPTWFDRDLSIAGRVTYSNTQNKLQTAIINFKKPIAFIPSLAIHLSKKGDEIPKLDKQKQLPPILLQKNSQSPDFNSILKGMINKQEKINPKSILDFDLFLYDTHMPTQVGYLNEFIAGARIDNLLSCYCGLEGLIASQSKDNCLLVLNDHEEVGSQSDVGAGGVFLKSVLKRLPANTEDYYRLINQSTLISADNAHGIHPNHPEKHDDKHLPKLNQGPVIKINANQRYTTNANTSGYFKLLCQNAGIPYQVFVSNSNITCGSTIGPITSSLTGIKSVDVGAATFGMHSIRELCGVKDVEWMTKMATAFFKS
jgi:aspartyl aminopeptidase